MGFFKKWLPPIIYDRFINCKRSKYGWFGNFSSWNDAQSRCLGYDADTILQKVTSSLLQVKEGIAIYERDSMLFDKIEYSWPLLSGLLRAFVDDKCNELNIIDFGGSLGSTYYQNKFFLGNLNYQWNIVEQSNFVTHGKKYFENNQLHFYDKIEECYNEKLNNILIFSSVLQYLEEPFIFLKQMLLKYNFDYILIDRTPFIQSSKNRITIQKVNPLIYEASYPCWFFNEKEFIDIFADMYNIVSDFNALDCSNLKRTYYKGFIFKLKK